VRDLLAELKRRHVFRVAGAYLVVAWLALQVVDVLVPLLDAPRWVGRTILLVLVAGLPIALILAWAFDLTPEGVRRTEADGTSLEITTSRPRKLDRVIVAALVAGGLMIATRCTTGTAARRSVEWQVLTVIGAALGLPLGIFLAVLVTRALDEFDVRFEVPTGQLIFLVVLAVIVGLLAAITPARRAAKLNPLEALHYE